MKQNTTRLLVAAASVAALTTAVAEPLDPYDVALDSPEYNYESAASFSAGSGSRFEFVPYGWLAGINGSTGYDGIIADVDASFGDVLDNLDFAAFAAFGANFGRWGFFVDGSYVKVSTDAEINGPLFNKADISSYTGLGNIVGTFRAIESASGYSMDLYAGGRITYSKTEIRLQENLAPRDFGNSESTAWVDGIVGIKGHIPLGQRFFIKYFGDIGGGSSDLTWQAAGTLGFKITDLIDLRAGYRYLSTDYTKGDGEFVYDLDTSGITVGLGFTW